MQAILQLKCSSSNALSAFLAWHSHISPNHPFPITFISMIQLYQLGLQESHCLQQQNTSLGLFLYLCSSFLQPQHHLRSTYHHAWPLLVFVFLSILNPLNRSFLQRVFLCFISLPKQLHSPTLLFSTQQEPPQGRTPSGTILTLPSLPPLCHQT